MVEGQNIGVGEVGALACGDILKIFLHIIENIIVDCKVMVFGCVSAFAASTYLAEMLINMNIYDALKITNSYIAQKLGLPLIKTHCSVLAHEALQKAIKNYLVKNNIPFDKEKFSLGSNFFERKLHDHSTSQIYNQSKTLDISTFNQNMLQISFSENARYRISKFFENNSASCLFVFVESYGCGFKYNYKIIDNKMINDTYIIVECDKFNIIFPKDQCSYFTDLKIDFVDKDLTSYLVFKKNSDVSYCNCGTTFNIKLKTNYKKDIIV